MKRLFLSSLLSLLLIFSASWASYAASDYDHLYEFKLSDPASDFSPLKAFIEKYSDVIMGGNAKVHIVSQTNTADAAGDIPSSQMVASTIEALKSYGLTDKEIVTESTSGDHLKSETGVTVRATIPSEMVIAGEEPKAEPKLNLGPFYLHTNMLYLATTTLNAGVEWRYDESHSVLLNGGYAHWKWDNQMRRYYVWYLSPEYRWHLGSLKRWHVGIQAQYGRYDIMLNTAGYKGEFYGGGITGGYNLPIGKRLALDFNLGLGYTALKDDKYDWESYPGQENMVRVRTEKGRSKNLIGPTQIGVNLVWHLTR